MRVIVTGCNGRLGSACAETLLAAGHAVAGIDCAPASGRPHPVIVDDLLNPYAIHRAFDLFGGRVDAVVHSANHINSLVAPPETVLRENQAMNASVFAASFGAGVRRVVFVSSIQAMLGGVESDGSWCARVPPVLPLSEAMAPRPLNVYGLSKVLAERALDGLCDAGSFGARGDTGPMSAVSVRLPYVLNREAFLANAKRKPPSEFVWGGCEAFAYIAREDAAEAVRLAVEAEVVGHEVVWCAAPDPRTPEGVAELAERFYASVAGIEACVARGSFVDCSKAERVLGWRASRLLREERGAPGRV
ncbi:MAG TPA: hypothetical protein DEB06_11025 [Phycisphaerales bacterium]|nr:hypothetical protein [Phycisphaerales bacterium]